MPSSAPADKNVQYGGSNLTVYRKKITLFFVTLVSFFLFGIFRLMAFPEPIQSLTPFIGYLCMTLMFVSAAQHSSVRDAVISLEIPISAVERNPLKQNCYFCGFDLDSLD